MEFYSSRISLADLNPWTNNWKLPLAFFHKNAKNHHNWMSANTIEPLLFLERQKIPNFHRPDLLLLRINIQDLGSNMLVQNNKNNFFENFWQFWIQKCKWFFIFGFENGDRYSIHILNKIWSGTSIWNQIRKNAVDDGFQSFSNCFVKFFIRFLFTLFWTFSKFWIRATRTWIFFNNQFDIFFCFKMCEKKHSKRHSTKKKPMPSLTRSSPPFYSNFLFKHKNPNLTFWLSKTFS